MCLKIDKSRTASMKRRKNNLVITCYKVVNADWTNLYQSYAIYKYQVGWNHSNISVKDLFHNDKSRRYVNQGIHVLKTLEAARTFKYSHTGQTGAILECLCHVSDLLGVGMANDMAFSRVYVNGEVS